MNRRGVVGRWVARADRLHGLGQRHWRELSPFDRRWMIVPYLGFGTRERLQVGGRVLRHVTHRDADPSLGAWVNFAEFWKRMETDEVPGAHVQARFRHLVVGTVADDEGHFEFRLEPAVPLENAGWHRIDLELMEPKPRSGQAVSAAAQVLVPPETARFGVISDIDDTVVWSNVRHKLRMLSMLVRTNAHTRKPFKGVAAFYRALHDGAGGGESNPVFYVSSSPRNLYVPLVEFLALQGLPGGPLMLRDFGDHLLFAGGEHRDHKLRCIEQVFATSPELPFVLIGDSGERDPEIYAELVHDHPGRVRVVYIRSVDPDPSRIAAIDRLVETLRPAGVPLVLAPDSEFAAVHAASEGLIATAALAAVRQPEATE